MGEMLPSVEEGMPYFIVDFMGSMNDFSNVLYPGNRSDCIAFPLPDTNILELGMVILDNGIQAILTREFEKVDDENVVLDTFSLQLVITVCTSFHDDVGVNAAGDALTGENHAGGPAPESACVGCHGAGLPLGVAEVHLPLLPTL